MGILDKTRELASNAADSAAPSGTGTASEQARPDAPVAGTEKVASSHTGHKTLFIIGLSVLLLWALRDVWYYGLFGAAFDLRLWLLGIPVYLLYRRSKKPTAKSKLPPAVII